MLDYRHETFLTLYEIGSYTKTAKAMNLTQPAVTQHIQFLEGYYKCKLFEYKGKALLPTQSAHKLYNFAAAMRSDSEKLRLNIGQTDKTSPLVFGATLTIGEYIMPNIVAKLLSENPRLAITMQVGNTKTLLKKLAAGEVDFVLLEGFFDVEDYESRLLARAKFIPVCAADASFAKGSFSFKELLSARLITREKGSGTREVLEQVLTENNLSMESFQSVCEIGNMSAIKQLVERNLGIAFLYSAACEKELAEGRLARVALRDADIQRAFNFVHLKNSLRTEEFAFWFEKISSGFAVS